MIDPPFSMVAIWSLGQWGFEPTVEFMAIDKGQPTGLKAKLTGPDTNMITWGFAAKHFSRPRGHYNLFRVVVSLFIFRPPCWIHPEIFVPSIQFLWPVACSYIWQMSSIARLLNLWRPDMGHEGSGPRNRGDIFKTYPSRKKQCFGKPYKSKIFFVAVTCSPNGKIWWDEAGWRENLQWSFRTRLGSKLGYQWSHQIGP